MLICRKVEYLNFRCKATIRHQVALLDGVISKICKNGKNCRHLQILPILHPTTQCWLMSLSEKRTKPKQGNEDDFLWQISRLKVTNQSLYPPQIIWVCPDIWVFSVLHNRHLSDIWVICQKCQFGVRKAWKALFLQLKPQEMHCKQADSATLKIYFLDSIQILQI